MALELRELVPEMAAALGEEDLTVYELNGFIVIEERCPMNFEGSGQSGWPIPSGALGYADWKLKAPQKRNGQKVEAMCRSWR